MSHYITDMSPNKAKNSKKTSEIGHFLEQDLIDRKHRIYAPLQDNDGEPFFDLSEQESG
ncbi:MAG: hypothetical protein IPM37_23285 [Hahellaceae bacterium]|nr:hypothetical protein [Hahellaceae bacterium]